MSTPFLLFSEKFCKNILYIQKVWYTECTICKGDECMRRLLVFILCVCLIGGTALAEILCVAVCQTVSASSSWVMKACLSWQSRTHSFLMDAANPSDISNNTKADGPHRSRQLFHIPLTIFSGLLPASTSRICREQASAIAARVWAVFAPIWGVHTTLSSASRLSGMDGSAG